MAMSPPPGFGSGQVAKRRGKALLGATEETDLEAAGIEKGPGFVHQSRQDTAPAAMPPAPRGLSDLAPPSGAAQKLDAAPGVRVTAPMGQDLARQGLAVEGQGDDARVVDVGAPPSELPADVGEDLPDTPAGLQRIKPEGRPVMQSEIDPQQDPEAYAAKGERMRQFQAEEAEKGRDVFTRDKPLDMAMFEDSGRGGEDSAEKINWTGRGGWQYEFNANSVSEGGDGNPTITATDPSRKGAVFQIGVNEMAPAGGRFAGQNMWQRIWAERAAMDAGKIKPGMSVKQYEAAMRQTMEDRGQEYVPLKARATREAREAAAAKGSEAADISDVQFFTSADEVEAMEAMQAAPQAPLPTPESDARMMANDRAERQELQEMRERRRAAQAQEQAEQDAEVRAQERRKRLEERQEERRLEREETREADEINRARDKRFADEVPDLEFAATGVKSLENEIERGDLGSIKETGERFIDLVVQADRNPESDISIQQVLSSIQDDNTLNILEELAETGASPERQNFREMLSQEIDRRENSRFNRALASGEISVEDAPPPTQTQTQAADAPPETEEEIDRRENARFDQALADGEISYFSPEEQELVEVAPRPAQTPLVQGSGEIGAPPTTAGVTAGLVQNKIDQLFGRGKTLQTLSRAELNILAREPAGAVGGAEGKQLIQSQLERV